MQQALLASSRYGSMAPLATTVQASPTSTGTKVSSAPKDVTMRIILKLSPNYLEAMDYIIDLMIIGLIVVGWIWSAAN